MNLRLKPTAVGFIDVPGTVVDKVWSEYKSERRLRREMRLRHEGKIPWQIPGSFRGKEKKADGSEAY